MGGGTRRAGGAVPSVSLALAPGGHRRRLAGDGVANPACRPPRTVGQRVSRLRRDRARRLCLPVDVARRLARRLALPSGLHRRGVAGDPPLSVVPVAGPPRRLGFGALALPPGAAAGRRGFAGRRLFADEGALPAAVAAALGLRALRPGGRHRRFPAAGRPPWTAD